MFSPKPETVGSFVTRVLHEGGATGLQAQALASLLPVLFGIEASCLVSNAPRFERFEHFVDLATRPLRQDPGDVETAAFLVLRSFAINYIKTGLPPSDSERAAAVSGAKAFVQACRQLGVSMSRALIQQRSLEVQRGRESMQWLGVLYLEIDAATATEFVSRESVCLLGDNDDWCRMQRSYNNSNAHLTDCCSAMFWLEIVGPSALSHLLDNTADLEEAEMIRLARGIAYATGVWPRGDGDVRKWDAAHPEYFAERGEEFADLCRGVFVELDRRVAASERPSQALVHTWMRYAWMAVDLSDAWVDDALRARLIRAAADEIGVLRPALRRADAEAASMLEQIGPHFASCLFVLFRLGTLWQATKPLLLAFRATGTPSVSPDLRYWGVGKADDPPRPWEIIPRSLMNMLHSNMGRAIQHDPGLENLRTEFAEFCLSRLKSKDPRRTKGQLSQAATLTESNPVWREGWIQAARALRVNPKGDGHNILHWVANNDPDEGVREVAREAYEDLRHQPHLHRGYSPRRSVFDAFWWLRQAHLASLNVSIDREGADHTREEEARRTTQAEQPLPG